MTIPYSIVRKDRELARHYIPMSQNDEKEILDFLGLKRTDDLFNHISQEIKFDSDSFSSLFKEIGYEDLLKHMEEVSQRNLTDKTCFIGDSLLWYSLPKELSEISSLRGLTTAYTPYQSERGQGTLVGLWAYTSLMSKLTGMEAINASLYDRSMALVEAVFCAERLKKNKKIVYVSEGIFPQEINVLKTKTHHRQIELKFIPLHKESGLTDYDLLKQQLKEDEGKVSAVLFQQVNSLGLAEDVDLLTDLSHCFDALAVCSIDPHYLSAAGVKRPSLFGSKKEGVDIIVGEGQSLAIGPNFGGPGLGIFGMRYNEKDKNSIRSMPGRLIGKAKDISGKECLTLILSTREQHIRRDKATSNICSNQSFIATLAGATLLLEGSEGLRRKLEKSKENISFFLQKMNPYWDDDKISLAFKDHFINEVILKTKKEDLLASASKKANIQLGVDISERLHHDKSNSYVKIFFNDLHTHEEIGKIVSFLIDEFSLTSRSEKSPLPSLYQTPEQGEVSQIRSFSSKEVLEFYHHLNRQNVSPDDHVYALGSCTMKYNPQINDYAASLPLFTKSHPQALEENVQGNLHILYEIQEMFKKITGLHSVVTQCVAGAHGELAAIKMFQAYFEDKKDTKRKIILIPETAHGTNPATATYAGVEKIVLLKSDKTTGQIDLEDIKEKVALHGENILGVMITNPNTSGVFETNFKKIAELIHSVGALVYMDGANMNAIAGIVNLKTMGVDAVHNNLHKTWSIPHGGGGPGDAIVAVCEKLAPYIPGTQVEKDEKTKSYKLIKKEKSIGDIHRHHGNFAHKVRCYTYLKALGSEGVRRMSSIAVLSARYLGTKIQQHYPLLPRGATNIPRMHEFIITLEEELFKKIESKNIPKNSVIPLAGKLFLDFGLHSPTVAFPEVYGLMIEPTESFTKKELDHFIQVVTSIKNLLEEFPSVLKTTPHFTPVQKIDEAAANRLPLLSDDFDKLPILFDDSITPSELIKLSTDEVFEKILEAHDMRISTEREKNQG